MNWSSGISRYSLGDSEFARFPARQIQDLTRRCWPEPGAERGLAPLFSGFGRHRLLIHADDVGLNQEVNDETFRFVDEGLIDAGSIMANGAAWREACDGARRRSFADWGVHLNLTEGLPLSSNRALSPILDQAGRLNGGRLHRALELGTGLRRAIFQEWSAQIDRLIDNRVRPNHIDSHHHIHFAPLLFPVLKAIQRKYAIARVRPPVTILAADDVHPFARRLRKMLWRWGVGMDGRTELVEACGDLLSLCTSPDQITVDRPTRNDPPMMTIELVVHPGSATWGQELRALRQVFPEQPQALRMQG